MGREYLVLSEHAVDGRAEPSMLDLLRDVTEDVVGREVGADAVADLPALDLLAERDDLSGQV